MIMEKHTTARIIVSIFLDKVRLADTIVCNGQASIAFSNSIVDGFSYCKYLYCYI